MHKKDSKNDKDEAEKLGINFSKSGPPRFKNERKKEEDLKKSEELKEQ